MSFMDDLNVVAVKRIVPGVIDSISQPSPLFRIIKSLNPEGIDYLIRGVGWVETTTASGRMLVLKNVRSWVTEPQGACNVARTGIMRQWNESLHGIY